MNIYSSFNFLFSFIILLYFPGKLCLSRFRMKAQHMGLQQMMPLGDWEPAIQFYWNIAAHMLWLGMRALRRSTGSAKRRTTEKMDQV